MVIIVITEVTTSTIRPAVVRPLALAENWFRYLKIWLLIWAGIRWSARKPCSEDWNEENIGKAVNSAKATVTSGTTARIVVKVRLPATCGIRSSAPRFAANRARRRIVTRSTLSFGNGFLLRAAGVPPRVAAVAPPIIAAHSRGL